MKKIVGLQCAVGMEIHLQLSTSSKLFSSSPCINSVLSVPNSRVHPFDAAFPGTLPCLNESVVSSAIRLGLALGGSINQITQKNVPIITGGMIPLPNDDNRAIRLERVQIEMDSGKSVHGWDMGSTLIDLNRAGAPLLEIVTCPDLTGPDEAADLLREIQLLARHLKISTANVDDGELRADVNVSLYSPDSPIGPNGLGVITEIKNVNGSRHVRKAIAYEIERQSALISRSVKIQPETRNFDAGSGKTTLLRLKEEEADYKFMPEPDLPPLRIPHGMVESLISTIPELPYVARQRLRNPPLSLPDQFADLLVSRQAVTFFEDALSESNRRSFALSPSAIAGPTANLLLPLLQDSSEDEGSFEFTQIPLDPQRFVQAIHLHHRRQISNLGLKAIISKMFEGDPNSPHTIAETDSLLLATGDEINLPEICEQVLIDLPKAANDFARENKRALRRLVGEAMKISKGKIDPAEASAFFTKWAEQQNKNGGGV